MRNARHHHLPPRGLRQAHLHRVVPHHVRRPRGAPRRPRGARERGAHRRRPQGAPPGQARVRTQAPEGRGDEPRRPQGPAHARQHARRGHGHLPVARGRVLHALNWPAEGREARAAPVVARFSRVLLGARRRAFSPYIPDPFPLTPRSNLRCPFAFYPARALQRRLASPRPRSTPSGSFAGS